MALLEVEGLVKSYGGRRVVDGVTFEVEAGEIVGLLGPNGAGKTTSFRIAMGMIPHEAGRVRLNGEDVSRLPMYQRARLGMGYLSQEPSVFRRMSVEDNIMAILETLPLSRRERQERLGELLSNLSLTRLSQNMADTLSGGERRRLEITRALVIDPMVMLLDEPFSGVDPKACVEIHKIIAALRAGGMSILLTDHNVWETLTITDRSYIIHEGRVLKHGTGQELIHDPDAQRLYLGDRFAGVQESFTRAKAAIEARSQAQHAGLRMRQTTRVVRRGDKGTTRRTAKAEDKKEPRPPSDAQQKKATAQAAKSDENKAPRQPPRQQDQPRSPRPPTGQDQHTSQGQPTQHGQPRTPHQTTGRDQDAAQRGPVQSGQKQDPSQPGKPQPPPTQRDADTERPKGPGQDQGPARGP